MATKKDYKKNPSSSIQAPEPRLTLSKEQYRDLVENAPVGIYKSNVKGEILYVNDALVDIFEFDSAEQLMAEGVFSRYMRVEDRGKFIETLKKKGSLRNYELEVLTKERKVKHILLSATLSGSEISGMVRDITKRREAMGALEERERHFRSLFEVCTDFIHLLNENGVILQTNPEALRRLGYQDDEFIGRRLVEFFTPGSREKFQHNFPLLLDGHPYRQEVDLICKDGETISVDCRATTVPNVKGDLAFCVFFQRDITERKRAEEKLLQTMEELERSNAELEQFGYVISHDLQEPLRMVSSFTGLLQRDYKGKLGSEADEFIRYIFDGAKRAQAMINDLLEYSRVGIRGGKFIPTDCEKVLERVLHNLRLAIDENNAKISYDSLPKIMADEAQMLRLFQNLIANAIKFHGNQPPVVHIGAERKDDKWLFSVRDNGIGINPEQSERIFMIFQRLHPIGQYSGTGIGLAICKKIVERHGGEICLMSEPGKGSTFYFTIPAG